MNWSKNTIDIFLFIFLKSRSPFLQESCFEHGFCRVLDEKNWLMAKVRETKRVRSNLSHPESSRLVFFIKLIDPPDSDGEPWVNLTVEISGFFHLLFCQNERFLSFLSLYIFEERVFIFQFLNDKMHIYVKLL